MRITPAALAILLALPGCGHKPAATAADGNSTVIAIAPDEEPSQPSGAPAGITAIDAATGDGQAMPADSVGPSAFDLAQRAERAREAEARAAPARAPDPVRLDAPTDVLGDDEAVTAGG